jgi:hypothetical protein
MPIDRSKALVSRSALERVLARAAELQGGDGEQPETLTEAQIEELGKEVGLSAAAIRQALAEERGRVELPTARATGLSYQLFGVDSVGAQRVVRGKPDRVLATLDRWMRKDQALRVLRQRPDFLSWEPERGVIGSLRRLFSSGDYALFRADEISASVVPVDDQQSLVRLQATFAGLRSAMGNRAAMGTVIGAASTGAALLMGFIVPVAVVPVVLISAGSFYSGRRTQEQATSRAALALEVILDRLERGDTEPPSLLRIIESALPPSR